MKRIIIGLGGAGLCGLMGSVGLSVFLLGWNTMDRTAPFFIQFPEYTMLICFGIVAATGFLASFYCVSQTIRGREIL